MKKTLFVCIALVCAVAVSAADVLVKNGERVAFLGDSITALGSRGPGYVNLVVLGLKVNGINIVKIPAGVSGYKSDQMLAKVDRLALSKKPQWLLISCGVNDVYHQLRKKGVELPEYKQNITAIVKKAQASGVKVALLTATMLQEDSGNDLNAKLALYNEFLREFARENNLLLFDVNKAMQEKIASVRSKNPIKGNILTVDGIHMNTLGNMVMAETVLRGMGLDDTQISKAYVTWRRLRAPISDSIVLSVDEYQKLADKAFATGKGVPEFVAELIKNEIR